MTCHNLSRAFTHDEVCCGYYPFRTIAPLKGYSKPGAGHEMVALPKHGGFAIQSVRNPHRLADPGPRPLIRGYAWGYARATGISCYVDFAQLEYHESSKLCTGPAGEDYEAGHDYRPREKKPNGCGHLAEKRLVKRVNARETHIRYSARGTSWSYLHYGDTVEVLIPDAPQGFSFVKVLTASPDGGVKPGAFGYVWTKALR